MALIKCPECGKSISDKAIKCPNCGHVHTPIVASSQPNKKRNNTMIVVLVLLIVLTVVIGCFAVLLTRANNTEKGGIEVIGTSNAQKNAIDINAYIFDNDGDFTNIRNSPKGKVIDKIPTGQGRFGVWVDDKTNGWYHIRDSKVFDSEKGIVRELNGSDCWIHESIIVLQ